MTDHAPIAVIPAVVAPAHPAGAVVSAVTEPVANVVETVQDATNRKLDELIDLAKLHNDHLARSHEATERVLGHLGNVSNALVETSGHVAEAAATVAGESAQSVLAVPAIPAQAADEVVEKVDPENAGEKKRARKDQMKRRK